MTSRAATNTTALALLWLAGCSSSTGSAETSSAGAGARTGGGSASLAGGGQSTVPPTGSGGAITGGAGASSSMPFGGNGGAATGSAGATAQGGDTINANGGATNGGATPSIGGANAGGSTSGGGNAGSANGSAGTAGASCPGLFCEDFESGSIDPKVWNAQSSGGQTVTVQSMVTAHGKYAVQFHAKPNLESYDFIITKQAPAALHGHHFGRAYFNVTPKPPAEHTEFLFAGSTGFPKLKYLEVAGIGTAWQLTYVDLVAGGESYASGGNAPDARWICLEWEFNDTPDQATVFVDGTQSYARSSITFNGQSSGLVGGFSDFGFGYYAWHPASYAFDVYYDDIVLDTKRVGCLSQ